MHKGLINTLFFAALLVLTAIIVASYQDIHALLNTNERVVHTYQVIEVADDIQLALLDAESNQRGYLISGDAVYLADYKNSISEMNNAIVNLKQLTIDNPNQQKRIRILEQLLKERVAIFQKVLDVYTQQSQQAALALVSKGEGRFATEKVKENISDINKEELALLKQRSDLADKNSFQTSIIVMSGHAISIILFLIVFILLSYQLKARAKARQQLQQTNEKLSQGLNELKQYNNEITLLSEMSRALQSCLTVQEAYAPINIYCQQILAFTSGVLYIMHPSRNYLEAVADWGEPVIKEQIFSPDQCWALRSGQLHHADKMQQNLLCSHIKNEANNKQAPLYICIPLMAQNDTLGLLYLELLPSCELTKVTVNTLSNKQLLMITVAEQISLALANIRLRETLRFQSIRDPLTGLFNRRYLEESMARELQRAERNRTPLAVIMLDVDHFKRFNDTHGHDAGDVVLRELGYVLQSHTRESDIACRYGGEEFVLFLYESTAEVAVKRAEELRQAVRHIHVKYGTEQLGTITISQGIALFPQHGNNAEALINAADTALYQAKNAGRDCAIIYKQE